MIFLIYMSLFQPNVILFLQPEITNQTYRRFFVFICFTFLLQIKNVTSDVVQGKVGKIYIPDQQVRTLLSPSTYFIFRRSRISNS